MTAPARPTIPARKLAGTFLAGATSRLLPASIPLRFFGAAAFFHVFAWLALLAGAPVAARFAGGLGWPLASLHLVTLGVLAMTAIGASLQLLPVATRQPVHSTRWPAAIWWLYTPGVALLTLGMGTGHAVWLATGASAVVVALVGYLLLLARNFVGARGMLGVVAHGWAALASLLVVLTSAVSLAFAYVGWPILARGTALALHVAFAAYGFMGLLALGLGYILVPMFALSSAPDEKRMLASCGLGVLALLLAGAAALGAWPQALRIGAIVAAAAGVALHLQLMTSALRTGMRRELGRSFRLVRIAWALLVASLVVALAWVAGVPWDALPTLFGVVLVPGWLLTLVLGMLQRIVPFLASMHKPPGTKLPRTPSSLTADRPLAVHFACHLAALALLALAVVLDNAWVMAGAAIVGTAGAVAFAAFFVILLQRMSTPPAPRPARPATVA